MNYMNYCTFADGYILYFKFSRLLRDVKEVRQSIQNVTVEFTDQPSIVIIRFPANVLVFDTTTGHLISSPEVMYYYLSVLLETLLTTLSII